MPPNAANQPRGFFASAEIALLCVFFSIASMIDIPMVFERNPKIKKNPTRCSERTNQIAHENNNECSNIMRNVRNQLQTSRVVVSPLRTRSDAADV